MTTHKREHHEVIFVHSYSPESLVAAPARATEGDCAAFENALHIAISEYFGRDPSRVAGFHSRSSILPGKIAATVIERRENGAVAHDIEATDEFYARLHEHAFARALQTPIDDDSPPQWARDT